MVMQGLTVIYPIWLCSWCSMVWASHCEVGLELLVSSTWGQHFGGYKLLLYFKIHFRSTQHRVYPPQHLLIGTRCGNNMFCAVEQCTNKMKDHWTSIQPFYQELKTLIWRPNSRNWMCFHDVDEWQNHSLILSPDLLLFHLHGFSGWAMVWNILWSGAYALVFAV